MRIKWRGLELPSKVVADPKFKTGTFGRFIVEPFEQGFGVTIGNSLRRVLLSALDESMVEDLEFGFADTPAVVERLARRAESLIVLQEADRMFPRLS